MSANQRWPRGPGTWLRKPVLRLVLPAALLLAGLVVAGGMSANYRQAIEALTCGGGGSQSASYAQPDSAVGQGVTGGFSSGAQYHNHAGVVQPVPGGVIPENRAREWQQYR